MRHVIVTTEARPFDGVFWKSYVDAAGPDPAAVVVLPTANEGTSLEALLMGPLMLGVSGFARLGAASELGLSWGRDRERGLHLGVEDVFSVPFERVDDVNSPETVDYLLDLAPDVLVSVGASQIFSEDVLGVPERACLNVHNGCLPAFRGQYGTFWEKYTGRDRGCVAVHEMTEEVDRGRVIRERKVDISGSLFAATYRKKVVGGRVLARLLDGGGLEPASGDRSERPSGYWSWPELSDALKFRLELMARRIR